MPRRWSHDSVHKPQLFKRKDSRSAGISTDVFPVYQPKCLTLGQAGSRLPVNVCTVYCGEVAVTWMAEYEMYLT